MVFFCSLLVHKRMKSNQSKLFCTFFSSFSFIHSHNNSCNEQIMPAAVYCHHKTSSLRVSDSTACRAAFRLLLSWQYTWLSAYPRVSGQTENSILHLINFINTTIFSLSFFFSTNIHIVFQIFHIMKVITETKVRHTNWKMQKINSPGGIALLRKNPKWNNWERKKKNQRQKKIWIGIACKLEKYIKVAGQSEPCRSGE